MQRVADSLLVDASAVRQATAQRPSIMSESSPHPEQTGDCSERDGGRLYRICDTWYLGLVLLICLRTGEVLAGEQVSIAGDPAHPDFNASNAPGPLGPLAPPEPLKPVALDLRMSDLPESKIFPQADFRPHGHSILEKEPATSGFEDAPMLHGTTVWQRLSDYRTHDQVRLLTLWETGGSTISLLAGKKGEPSLQWTSRSMSHGHATGGLLDHLFSTSLESAARGLRFSPRTSGTDATAKQSKPTDAAVSGPNK
jgi:hypothetical protein